ncbi:MAG: CoA-transferase [Solirubrobacterales bacterium]|jgi:glutaconate CoA-transferase subunit B|nr:CoA-transferase [Solirubrobacterales bacterium]
MNPQDTATLMTCRLAREIRNGDVVGVGLGTPLALAAALLARRTHAPGADVIVAGAVSPDADLATCLRGASALAGRTAGYAVHLVTMEMAERWAMTLQFLRPAQIDGAGNANTSRIVRAGELVQRLPGGLATADVFKILPRIVLYHTDHRPRSLPERVGFLTAAGGGDRVTGTEGPVRLVTDRAVIAFDADRPRLESVHPGEDADAIRSETGFPLAAGDVPETAAPTDVELAALHDLDPHALRELELRATQVAAAERLAAAHA